MAGNEVTGQGTEEEHTLTALGIGKRGKKWLAVGESRGSHLGLWDGSPARQLPSGRPRRERGVAAAASSSRHQEGGAFVPPGPATALRFPKHARGGARTRMPTNREKQLSAQWQNARPISL
jgi:hypothetical protein